MYHYDAHKESIEACVYRLFDNFASSITIGSVDVFPNSPVLLLSSV